MAIKDGDVQFFETDSLIIYIFSKALNEHHYVRIEARVTRNYSIRIRTVRESHGKTGNLKTIREDQGKSGKSGSLFT